MDSEDEIEVLKEIPQLHKSKTNAAKIKNEPCDTSFDSAITSVVKTEMLDNENNAMQRLVQ